MIESEYYKNYNGPELVLAQIWTHDSQKEKITDHIREFYGEECNWNGMLYTYNEIFPERTGHKFYLEFRGSDGRKHWFSGLVGSDNQIFNHSLVTPVNQNLITKKI